MYHPERVAALAAGIVVAEGEYTVAGRYYADAADAAKARLVEAERRARLEHAAELRRAMLGQRWEVTDAGRAAVQAERDAQALRTAVELLVDGRACFVDRHGCCITHDQPCDHSTGTFVCPVTLGRRALATRRIAS